MGSMNIRPEDARVLVVEDDPDNLIVVLDLLSVAGVRHVVWVTQAGEAPAGAERLGQVDIVLLDVNLPDRDGREMIPPLRAVPACANARIVAVTASVMPDDFTRARAAGFDGFIGKPLDFDRFPQQIEALLRGEPVWSAR